MAKHTSLELYRSGTGDELYKTQQFVYRIEINKLSKNGYELMDTQFIALNEFKQIKPGMHRKLNDGTIIYREAELFGAPESYLIQNNYEKRSD